jgi:hypothetical protein
VENILPIPGFPHIRKYCHVLMITVTVRKVAPLAQPRTGLASFRSVEGCTAPLRVAKTQRRLEEVRVPSADLCA